MFGLKGGDEGETFDVREIVDTFGFGGNSRRRFFEVF